MCDYMELARNSDATRRINAQLATAPQDKLPPAAPTLRGQNQYVSTVGDAPFQHVPPADLSTARSANEGPYTHYAPDICPKCGPEGQRMQRAALSQFSNGEVVFYCPKHNLTQLQPDS